jgi:hypothetical protein
MSPRTPMKTILIPTVQDDTHAACVALVLQQMGHRPWRWFCQDLPEAATASFRTGAADRRVSIRQSGEPGLDVSEIDVLWNRRVEPPIIKNPDVHASDRLVAKNELTRLVQGLMHTFSDRAFAVNQYSAALSANKLRQLQGAQALGLAVPETLVSNDPDDIKAFLREHQAAGTIFKSFRPVQFDEGDRVAAVHTHPIAVDMLPRDQFLQLSPGIFQAYVPKAFEARVTCMGGELFAARLDSQQTANGKLDWRLEHPSELPVGALELPVEVAKRCRALLQRLGLVFGCIDFIVTPAGEYVFLEVNQMGQFLWVEQANPEFPLLQAFAEFLVSGDPEFRFRSEPDPRFAFASVHPHALELVQEDRAKHVQPNEYWQIVREAS